MLAQGREQARAVLIREAVADYLAKHRAIALDDAFGVWGKKDQDAMAYQEEIRGEW